MSDKERSMTSGPVFSKGFLDALKGVDPDSVIVVDGEVEFNKPLFIVGERDLVKGLIREVIHRFGGGLGLRTRSLQEAWADLFMAREGSGQN